VRAKTRRTNKKGARSDDFGTEMASEHGYPGHNDWQFLLLARRNSPGARLNKHQTVCTHRLEASCMPSHPLHQVELAMNAAASSSFQRQPGGLLELLGQLPSLEFPRRGQPGFSWWPS